jgi:hypothetical protein
MEKLLPKLKVCSTCPRSVHSYFNGQPYCSTHYRSEREKYRNKVLRDLLTNIDMAMDRSPAVKQLIDHELLQCARDTFRDLKERKADKKLESNDSIEELRKELASLKSLVLKKIS